MPTNYQEYFKSNTYFYGKWLEPDIQTILSLLTFPTASSVVYFPI